MNAIDAQKFGALTEQIRAGMERHGIPGVAVGLCVDGGEWAEGFGVTSLENPLPVTPDTLFQVGSISKTFTGTLVMRLVEAGKLELDVPVRRYLPDLELADESVAEAVTLRHLLTHTAGWAGDLFIRTGNGEDALHKYVLEMARLKQLTPLGKVWSYNNAAFALAGRVIEAVMDQPYEVVCREWILQPLGLGHSFFFPEEVMVHRFAVGHLPINGEPRIAHPWALARNANAVGGLSSTVRDLLRYARFHLNGGKTEGSEQILSPESVAAMQIPQVSAADRQQMGLSWFLREVNGVRIVSHGGATNGQMASLWFVPARRFAFAILTNHHYGGLLNNEVGKWARENLLGMREPTREPVPARPEQFSQYAGRYLEGAMGNRIDLEPHDGGLVFRFAAGDRSGITDTPADLPPPMKVGMLEPDWLTLTDGPGKGALLEFLRDENGQIEWVRYSSRVYRRQ
ncbi:MAG TPA: serine hydrolase domain-containing protein [Meiothermus sp.]|nr:serine hydrolase domain-containing protein [Meiothermus sp.]